MVIQSWTEVVVNSLQSLWFGVINFLPSLIGALIVLSSAIIASGLRALIEKIVGVLKIDSLLKSIGLSPFFERAHLQINAGKFFGLLAYWFLTIVFIFSCHRYLGAFRIFLFLRDVLAYIPSIIIAVLIMLATFVLANFSKSVVKASVMSARLHASKFLGTLARWTIVVFGF